MLRSLGVLGLAGVALLLVWFVAWIFFGMGELHVLFPIALVLLIVQGVRRVAA